MSLDFKKNLLGLLLPMLGAVPALAQGDSPSGPGPRIPGVHEQMAKQVEQREIAGAVTLVTTPDRVIHLDTVGNANIERHQAMQPDTIFWIASMTKPITGAAVCKLESEGKLKLDDPVEKYIPEFKQLKNAKGEPVQVTLMQLLTHTSGMADYKPEEVIDIPTLDKLIPLYVAKPVKFQPGTKWEYCQSGINTAGRIVELVTGMPFQDYLQQEFFGPLGMVDTTFYLSEEQLPRLVTAYKRTDDGQLEVETKHRLLLLDKSPTSRDRFPAANGGLFSTALDYARFCQMLLNDGTLAGHQCMTPEAVKRLRTIQTPKEIVTGFTPGNGWGVATCVVREPQGINAMVSPGTYGHGGAYGTQVWIDPEKKLAWILMVQRSNYKNSDGSDARAAFQKAIFAK
ncbi:serine hydrolase domain-containing protein [Planctomicrobium piriforme]|uniref:CubicO group peptidase, beta-lactamase class C family n=1 Tax=Planctomicrobium piriforme TaxID=1576369 RepID=A0A1I3LT52_9PLAN|nr:serine hydrolase domain-containing protein [Planctomicrobium piriforme]SFI87954.1 CubicO group peptidase, beta-lactamase class C family [Planctomicrobium piriforme]